MAKRIYLRAEYMTGAGQRNNSVAYIHLGTLSKNKMWVSEYDFCIKGWRRLGLTVPKFKRDMSSYNGGHSIPVPVNITIKEIINGRAKGNRR